MEELTSQKKSNVLFQFGIIAALASLLIYVIVYVAGTDFYGSGISMFISFVLPIAIAVLACIRAKKENGGYLEFSQALKICFGVLVIASLTTSVFNYLLVNYFDPAFGERIVQLSIEKTQSILEKIGTPQDAIDKSIREMTFEKLFSAKSVFQSFMLGCIVQFIFALIIAAIMKKNKPEFAV